MISTRDFLARAAGRWAGTETFSDGPGFDRIVEATGRFVNEPALDGRGLAGPYTQEHAGGGLSCHVVHRFGDDGSVAVTWIAAEGAPRIFTGIRENGTMTIRGTHEHGAEMVIVSAFDADGTARSTTDLVLPDGATRRVFEGSYTRQPGPVGRPLWRDLTVADASGLRGFYEEVLGWAGEPVAMDGYDDYSMNAGDGTTVAGVCHARGANADLPPGWLVYFAVDSAERAAAAAEAGGGRVLQPLRAYEGYRFVVLADPAGNAFVACEERAR